MTLRRGTSRNVSGDYDVVVIGAGFGGLGAAMRLAEAGRRPLVLESLTYPGGCASTFERGGAAYESGATLFSGFAHGMLFHDWIERHVLDVEVQFHDPMVTFRGPGWTIDAGQDRSAWIEQFVQLAPDTEAELCRFFRFQKKVSGALWSVLGDQTLLPPFDVKSLLRHAGNVGAYVPLLRFIGRPLIDVLKHFRVDHIEPLVAYLNGLTRITVQSSVNEAEAAFALATCDYFFRGTGHVRGGIGELAWALVDAIEQLGGAVSFASRVRSVERQGDMWQITTRKGTVRAKKVVANLVPQALSGILSGTQLNDRAAKAGDAIESGWSARTFERFTGRPGGMVGGAPRTAGLHNYRNLGPLEAADGLFIVGDSVFPGQSTLAAALGGVRTAEAIVHHRLRANYS